MRKHISHTERSNLAGREIEREDFFFLFYNPALRVNAFVQAWKKFSKRDVYSAVTWSSLYSRTNISDHGIRYCYVFNKFIKFTISFHRLFLLLFLLRFFSSLNSSHRLDLGTFGVFTTSRSRLRESSFYPGLGPAAAEIVADGDVPKRFA